MMRPSRRLVIGALPSELTLGKVALNLGVTKNTVDNWRKRPKNPLPAYRNERGVWMVSTAMLRVWLGLDPRGT